MAKSILQTGDRVLEILEIMSEYEDGITATQLEKILGLNKVTVHRLISTLENRGFIEKKADSKNYTIGLKLVDICSYRLNTVELKTEAHPILRALVEEVSQPAHLAIRKGWEAVFIEKVERVNSIRMYSQIGIKIPLYCSSVGKALLMNLSDDKILEILDRSVWKKFTHTTMEDSQTVLQEIRESRIKGFTVDNEEHEEGIFCVAAPIYDYRGKVIAAISTAGKKKSFLQDDNDEIANKVKESAYLISKRMGFKN